MNKVILMGRLTKNPELRYTANNNTPVATFTIAVDRKFSGKNNEKKTDFINIVAWSGTAELASKHLSKGKRVLIEGNIQTRTWDDQGGARHYITEVIAENIEFADSNKSNEMTFESDNVDNTLYYE